MKKYDIYFTGSNRSFVSSIFLYSLIAFAKKNSQFNIKYIINTDTFFNFNQKSIIYRLKNNIKYITYFFLTKNITILQKI